MAMKLIGASCAFVALMTGVHAVAGTIGAPVTVRAPADIPAWQVNVGDATVRWLWSEGATRATLVVLDRLAKTERNFEVERTTGAVVGSRADVLPTSSDGQERLFDLTLTQYTGAEPVGVTRSARVVALPEAITVSPVASRGFRRVDERPRLFACETAARLSAVPVAGGEVVLADPAAVGYNVFCAKDSLSNYGLFYLALGEQVSEPLRYSGGGLVLCFQ